MSIRVTCPGCHTRFNVSEKFAGKEGPCPKCKAKIRIPAATEEVVIHEPEIGPKDRTGRAVLKPISRKDTKLSGVHITLIAALVVAFFAIAGIVRLIIEDKSSISESVLAVAALVLAFPVVYAAYTFLRDQELGSFWGRELWTRVGICSALYAALWAAMPVSEFAFGGKYELGTWLFALGAMLGIGGAVGMLALDFDYIFGLLHYGMYLGCCLIGRWVAGLQVFPGTLDQQRSPSLPSPVTFEPVLDLAQTVWQTLLS
jgi:hypothetical protein